MVKGDTQHGQLAGDVSFMSQKKHGLTSCRLTSTAEISEHSQFSREATLCAADLHF